MRRLVSSVARWGIIGIVAGFSALGADVTSVGRFRPDSALAADSPVYACYNRTDRAVRIVSSSGSCSRTEQAFQLNDARHQAWLCPDKTANRIEYAGSGSAPDPRWCAGAAASDYVRVPGANAEIALCVSVSTGGLTPPPCGSGQNRLTIRPRNYPPVANSVAAQAIEDGQLELTLRSSDPDGQDQTFAIQQPATFGSLGPITNTTCTGSDPRACTAVVTYTGNPDAFGRDVFTYVASDGSVTSEPARVSINLVAVNDIPGFTAGGNVAVGKDSGPYSAVWATNVTAGPNEDAGQTVTFHVSNDNAGLFSEQPAIAVDGTLSFTPAAAMIGTAIVTVYLTDTGGTADGGGDTSASKTFAITVS